MIHNTTSATPRLDWLRNHLVLALQELQGWVDWLEYNDDNGLALNSLKDELARLEAGDDDEEENEDDAEPEQ